MVVNGWQPLLPCKIVFNHLSFVLRLILVRSYWIRKLIYIFSPKSLECIDCKVKFIEKELKLVWTRAQRCSLFPVLVWCEAASSVVHMWKWNVVMPVHIPDKCSVYVTSNFKITCHVKSHQSNKLLWGNRYELHLEENPKKHFDIWWAVCIERCCGPCLITEASNLWAMNSISPLNICYQSEQYDSIWFCKTSWIIILWLYSLF